MLYEQHFIDELKNRADLVRIIEPYAPLKKKGANWMGCCPFHQEKTPSFSVNPSKGFYKCFGCAKGGNAFTFVMEIEGLNFPEAIKRVAEISGVPLPEPIDDKNCVSPSKKNAKSSPTNTRFWKSKQKSVNADDKSNLKKNWLKQLKALNANQKRLSKQSKTKH
jgi:DNA primase catalytic core